MRPVSIARYLDQVERNAGIQKPKVADAPALKAVASGDPGLGRPRPLFVRSRPSAADLPRQESEERNAFAKLAQPARAEPPRPAAPAHRDLDAALAQQFERGFQAGRAAGLEESRTRGEEEFARRQEQALMERVEFQMNEYAKFGNKINDGFVEIEERISAAVARLLAPFIEAQLTERVLDELRLAIYQIASSRTTSLIRIRGPERLLSRLREQLQELAVEIEYILEDRVDVSVEADDTIIESQLASWRAVLHGSEGL